MSKLKLIYAKSLNGVIGKDNEIPWFIPEDLARFKRLTVGHVVVMGRRTWESLPNSLREDRGLPQRVNVILSRPKPAHVDAEVTAIHQPVQVILANADERGMWNNSLIRAHSLEAYIEYHKEHFPTKDIWIIGGESVYNEALPLADEIYETLVDKIVEGGHAFAPVIAHKFKHFKPFRPYATDLSRVENSFGWETSTSGERYCVTAYQRVHPMPSAEEELSFYLAYGFPYMDTANGIAHNRKNIRDIIADMNPSKKETSYVTTDPGYWAIDLPKNRLSNSCDDGVLPFTMHAYTREALYTKAKKHIDGLLALQERLAAPESQGTDHEETRTDLPGSH